MPGMSRCRISACVARADENQMANTDAKGARIMSHLASLLPVSPGILYAVRKLLEYAPASESDARRLCARLWPKMDADAVQTVVVYWHVQAEPEHTPSSAVLTTAARPGRIQESPRKSA